MSSLYENAPVSLTLSLVTAISAMLYSGHPGRYALDLSKLMDGELSRLLSSFVVFNSPSQAFLSTLMLYSYRVFERQLGSSKYAAFFAVSFVCSLLLKLAVIVLGNLLGLHLVPASGPYFFLFAQLPFYYRYVPKITNSQYVLFGLEFSEKSWIYLLALQLLFSEGSSSLISGLVGLSVGYLYERNSLGVQRFRTPAMVMKIFTFVGTVFNTVFPSTPRGAAAPQRGAAPRIPLPQPGLAARGAAGATGMPPPNHDFFGNNLPEQTQQPVFQVAPPSDEAIQTLMALGFDREAVIQALRSADNNVDAAANRLLR